MDGVQDGLELIGTFPGIGILPDTVNAMIHVSRGNTNEANWAMAEMLPATGIAATIGKRAKKTAKKFMEKGVKDATVKMAR